MSRQHLTIADKNRLRAHHRGHPELTQEQLRDWAFTAFGQWVARSTVGHIIRSPEEVCANPSATRFQCGRYPDMEQELYSYIVSQSTSAGSSLRTPDGILLIKDAELWAKANEILKRTHGSEESVSVAWVHRFKKRHGLHRSQLKKSSESSVDEGAVIEQVGDKRSNDPEDLQPAKKLAAARPNRAHFTSADDILLLEEMLETKPWRFSSVMDGWHQVATKLRERDDKVDKTAGACQTRVNLLLAHLKAGNVVALRKTGTQQEYERKCDLLRQVGQVFAGSDTTEKPAGAVATEAPSVPRRDDAPCSIVDTAAERERMAQRRLELMERKMERELAAQKRHADEQVKQLEKLHREQMELQRSQHDQLLATIQQQQAMIQDLIKSVSSITSDAQRNV